MKIQVIICVAAMFLAADAKNDSKKEQDTILGDWKLVSLEIEGEKSSMPEETKRAKDGDFLRAAITPDKITLNYVVAGGAHTEELKYQVDNTKNPKWIDLKPSNQTIEGIYSVEKGTLKVCLTLMGKGRPKEFASAKDSHRVLAVFEREKKR
jgi:uncharacterized protein (TIGR03067 family)